MSIGVRNTTGRALTGHVGGRSVTIASGGRYDFPDICAAASFMHEAGASIVDNASGTLVAQLNRQAESSGCSHRFNSFAVPENADPPDENAGEDSPARVGAPTPDPPATTATEPTPYGSPGETRQPTEAVNDQTDPRPPGEVAQAVQNGDAGGGAGTDPNEETTRAEQGAPPAGEPRTSSHAGDRPAAPSTGGDPVDLFSGAFVIVTTDIDVPTPFLPLALVRRYRSGKPYFGPLGYNWDHNWNVFLRELKDGSVARWTGELHEDLFRKDGAGWASPRGVFERLVTLPGGAGYRIESREGLSSHYERPPTWTDAERIPLVRIEDAHGNAISIEYDSENRVRRVADDDGRFLQFSYGDCGFLESVVEHSGREVRYLHDQLREHLVAVALPPVAGAPEISESYEYALPNVHPAQRHNVIAVRDALRSVVVRNVYGLDPSQQSFNRVVEQWQGGFVHRFGYEMLQGLPNDRLFRDAVAYRTTAMYPDRSYWVYSFNPTGELIDDRVRLSHDGSFRVVARRMAYDEEGNVVSEVEPDGSETLRVYDALNPDPRMRGNLLRIERRAATGVPLPSRILMRLEYEPFLGKVRRVRYEGGARVDYTYDFDVAPGPSATGKLVRVDWPDATLPDGSVQASSTRFAYGPRGQQVEMIRPEGARDATEYFPAGSPKGGFVRRRVSDVDGAAEATVLDYDPAGFQSEAIAPGGAVTRYRTDARGRRERLEQPAILGAVDATEWDFHPNGQVARVRRPRGEYDDAIVTDAFIEESVEVDALGRATKRVLGANTARPRQTSIDTDYRGRPILLRHADGVADRSCFDERGLLLFVIRAYGSPVAETVKYVYDRCGRTTHIERPGQRVTKTEYDGWGRPFRTTYPHGSVEQIEYADRLDLPVEVTVTGDPGDGSPPRTLRRTSIEYDERGRPVRTTVWRFTDDPAVATALTETKWYDRDGRCVRRVTPTGDVWHMVYDGLGRLVRTTDPAGNVVETELGPDGLPHKTLAQDAGAPAPAVTHFVHDARGRLISQTDQDGLVTAVRYDARDYAVETTSPDGKIGRQAFGLLGEAVGETADASGLALTSRIDTDLLGRPLRYVAAGGAVTTLSRDPLGRIIAMSLPDGSVYGRQFAAGVGDLVGLTVPGGIAIGFDQDAFGRVTGLRTLAAGTRVPAPDQGFSYDGLGRLVRASVGGQQVTRRYDSLDRIISEDGGAGAISRVYDELARRLTVTHPDGWTEAHRFDSLGRVDRITLEAAGTAALATPPAGTVLASAAYRGTARVGALELESSSAVMTHDAAGRLAGVSFRGSGGTEVDRFVYGYDAEGRRGVLVQGSSAPMAKLYAYDGRGRLTATEQGIAFLSVTPPADFAQSQALIAQAQAAASGVSDTWSYGPDDTRLTFQPAGGAATSYASTPDARLVAVNGNPVVSDADGARISDPERSYVWDSFGRLVRATANGSITELAYDALGRLASVTRNGVIERQHWFDHQCVRSSDGSGAPRLRFLHHPNLPVPYAAIGTAERYNLHYDGHLDLVLVTTAAGSVANRVRYDAFGAPEVLNGMGAAGALPAGLVPIFGAMPFEPGPGLYLTRKRPYDPLTGLFLARDAALFSFSPNAYAFGVQDPVNRLDVEGDIAPLIVAGLIVGGIGALIGGASVVIRGGDYDFWDVLAAAGIGFGAGFIGAVTFGVAAEVIGGAGLAGAAGMGLTGTAAGTAATASGASAGLSVTTGILAGGTSGLASGIFSGFARANYTYARHGGDYWDMVGDGVLIEGTSGMVGGMFGGGMFAGATRMGVVPTGYWASLSGQSSRLTMPQMAPSLVMRGLASPYGAGSAAIGFGSGYSSGVTRRLLEGENAGDAFSNAVEDGAWGAGSGVASTALHPTSWMYWRSRFDPATAARIESIRGVGAHHQRNVAQYPEFATPRFNVTNMTWFERFYGRNIIGGNLTGRFSEYNNRQEHVDLHNLWRFGLQGSWTNMPGHGPWTPAWPVYTPPTDPRSSSQASK